MSVLQSNLLNTSTKGTVSTLYRCLCYSQTSSIQPLKGRSVHIIQVSMLQSNLLNTSTKGTVSTLYRCLCYSQTSLIQPPKGRVSTLHRCLCYSQTSLTPTLKGLSVHITQVSMLQSINLNSDTKGIECPHSMCNTGVYVTVKPP